MKTRLPFSTISYNSRDFLVSHLNELVQHGILSEWYAILHKGEDDEAGKKEHFHVWFMPSKQVQTDDIRAFFQEFDLQHPDKPRKCLSFGPSKFAPWCMYGLHDKAYLASKRQSRRYHYTLDDFLCSDRDVFLERYKEIDVLTDLGQYRAILEAQSLGLSYKQYIQHAQVPIQQVHAVQYTWNLLLSDKTDRDGAISHIDPDTGEVI